MPKSTALENCLTELVAGGKPALAAFLSRLETEPDSDTVVSVLDAAFGSQQENPSSQVIGLTGPPGVGKSTLTGRLARTYRAEGKTVGVIAVDPSSPRSGGALLGDRSRIASDPADDGLFVRSMAARDRLGGLGAHTAAAVVLLRALFDRVLVETVGVGQSETDISHSADTVVFCVQPASGDALQFMKAGIMEVPDIVAVTKSDLGAPAHRARADVEGAVSLMIGEGTSGTPVVAVSAQSGIGMDDLVAAIAARFRDLTDSHELADKRAAQAHDWTLDQIRYRFGRYGLELAAMHASSGATILPFRNQRDTMRRIAARVGACSTG